jgi:hypothetical protein
LVLIGYWPLNESSKDPDEPTAKDHSGNENHGTIKDGGDSTVPGATGILGKNAYRFDGSNDYVTVSDDSSLDVSGEISGVAWIRPDTDANPSSGIGNILRKGDSYIPVPRLNYGNDLLQFYVHIGGSWISIDYNKDPSDYGGEWHMLVGVYDGNQMKIYVDGKEVKRGSQTGTIDNSTQSLDIGRQGEGNGEYFDGRLSEVRIYNHALTAAEVQYLYNVSKRGRQVSSGKSS